MHRFRKKSDPKRPRPLENIRSPVHQGAPFEEPLPELPPASNFRTSLILPDLTRRFTLLRTSNGDPVSFDDLRSRFAEQRARGAENQISEEEEDMIFETLGRMRSKYARDLQNTNVGQDRPVYPDDADSRSAIGMDRQSFRSNEIISAAHGSAPSTPSNRSTKRYSNNLFGSGRFRDYNYVRSVTSPKSGGSQVTRSFASVESSPSSRTSGATYSDNSRSMTIDGGESFSSNTSSPGDKMPANRSALVSPHTGYSESSDVETDLEYALTRTLDPIVLKRASLALEQVIKELEEETEDEIVLPRSTPIIRPSVLEQAGRVPEIKSEVFSQAEVEAGTAISSDRQIVPHVSDSHETSPIPYRPGTASPTPRLPGYIPGMPRPMTPRDVTMESEDISRSHSTTPRATSPALLSSDHFSSTAVASLPSTILRRGSNASATRHIPRSSSPISSTLLSRNINGRFTPEDQSRGGEFSGNGDYAVSSPIRDRRRPASPLSGPAYQPMAVSSRPSTPSNVTWTYAHGQVNHQRNESVSTHSRNDSMADSDTGDIRGNLERSNTTTRSLRSPALPDSPLLEREFDLSPPERNQIGGQFQHEYNTVEGRGSPVVAGSPTMRSSTPIQSPMRSAILNYSPQDAVSTLNGSSRSLKQSPPVPTFGLASMHFSPVANSSRSSFESEGSSYHSWDAENKKDGAVDLLSDLDPPSPAWHDISNGKDLSQGSSQEDDWDPDDLIRRYAGLTRTDFLAIHHKLVGAALAKNSTSEPRERAPSLRRRRPSTSMSNHSVNGRENRVASPPPRSQSPVVQEKRMIGDTANKATTLLKSVVDSIQSSQSPISGASSTDSPMRTAQAFAHQEDQTPFPQRVDSDQVDAASGLRQLASSKLDLPLVPPPVVIETSDFTVSAPGENHAESYIDAPTGPIDNSVQQERDSIDNQGDLIREVQRRVEAATKELNKSPPIPQAGNVINSAGLPSRKKITPSQISTPRLMSASTSVDTIPLPSPSLTSPSQGSLKLGQRFKKFRGTIRKGAPSADDITPYPSDFRSTPLTSSASHSPPASETTGAPAATSATELGAYRAPSLSSSPLYSPGIKGFMSRFRRARPADSISGLERSNPPSTSLPAMSPQTQLIFHTKGDIGDSLPTPLLRSAPVTVMDHHDTRQKEPEGPNVDALKQLYTAASDLGLDPGDITALVARSASTSSRLPGRTRVPGNLSPATGSRPRTVEPISMDRIRPPHFVEEQVDGEEPKEPKERAAGGIVKKLSIRKRPGEIHRQSNIGGNGAVSTVVRRTIIFPSESRVSTIDPNTLLRKNSQAGRRRRSASVASVHSQSSRSVHDRVPTPPPPRSPTGRQFSSERSPPVPQLPLSLSAYAENVLQSAPAQPRVAVEKSNSAYDSLYDMYVGESRLAAVEANRQDAPRSPGTTTASEPGPAVEVIELANGETIWSIVNGLRDDDAESLYASRASLASEVSMNEYSNYNNEGLRVLFKEHVRKSSKDSGSSSFLSPKKFVQGRSRPETKVFYGSSMQITRLIENLSQGADSGSFNIIPNGVSGSSNPSSFHSDGDAHWTVEERLEHMLGSLKNA